MSAVSSYYSTFIYDIASLPMKNYYANQTNIVNNTKFSGPRQCISYAVYDSGGSSDLVWIVSRYGGFF